MWAACLTHRSLAARKTEEHIRPVAMRHLAQHVQQLGRVARPLAVHGLHGAEQQFQLLDGDAVAGQHAEHVDQ